MTPDLEAAALDALATNGPAQMYAKGYEAGLAATQTAELELVAGVFTPAQQARADAIHAAARIFAHDPTPAGKHSNATADAIVLAMLRIAGPLALYIEHGIAPDFDRHVGEALDIVRGTPTQT